MLQVFIEPLLLCNIANNNNKDIKHFLLLNIIFLYVTTLWHSHS